MLGTPDTFGSLYTWFVLMDRAQIMFTDFILGAAIFSYGVDVIVSYLSYWRCHVH